MQAAEVVPVRGSRTKRGLRCGIAVERMGKGVLVLLFCLGFSAGCFSGVSGGLLDAPALRDAAGPRDAADPGVDSVAAGMVLDASLPGIDAPAGETTTTALASDPGPMAADAVTAMVEAGVSNDDGSVAADDGVLASDGPTLDDSEASRPSCLVTFTVAAAWVDGVLYKDVAIGGDAPALGAWNPQAATAKMTQTQVATAARGPRGWRPGRWAGGAVSLRDARSERRQLGKLGGQQSTGPRHRVRRPERRTGGVGAATDAGLVEGPVSSGSATWETSTCSRRTRPRPNGTRRDAAVCVASMVSQRYSLRMSSSARALATVADICLGCPSDARIRRSFTARSSRRPPSDGRATETPSRSWCSSSKGPSSGGAGGPGDRGAGGSSRRSTSSSRNARGLSPRCGRLASRAGARAPGRAAHGPRAARLGLREVLSPSTAKNDLVDKMQTLHACEVPHYWIVDPEHETLTVYRFTREGYVVRDRREARGKSAYGPSRSTRSRSTWASSSATSKRRISLWPHGLDQEGAQDACLSKKPTDDKPSLRCG